MARFPYDVAMTIQDIFFDDQRNISQFVPGLSVPHRITVRDDSLVWEVQNYEGNQQKYKRVDLDTLNGVDLLTMFAALAEETNPQRFLTFARRWGVLGICRLHPGPLTFCSADQYNVRSVMQCGYETWLEEFPMNPTKFYSPPHRLSIDEYCAANEVVMTSTGFVVSGTNMKNAGLPIGAGLLPDHNMTSTKGQPIGWVCSEPLAVWRTLAADIRAVLKIRVSLHENEPCDPKDWATLESGVGSGRASIYPRLWSHKFILARNVAGQSVLQRRYDFDADHKVTDQSARDAKVLLAEVVNDWVRLAGIRPYLVWRGDSELSNLVLQSEENRPEAQLIGTLATLLLLAVNGTPGYAICANPTCKRLMLIRPHQSPKRAVYCEFQYCRRVAAAAAARRYRLANRRDPNRSRRPVAKLPSSKQRIVQRILSKVPKPLRPVVLKLAKKYKVSEATIYRQARAARRTGSAE